MVVLTFRAIAPPTHWKPAEATRVYSPFSSTHARTLEQLQTELNQLGARAVHLQLVAKDAAVRLDGQLRSDAKVLHPGAMLTIDTKAHGTLVYETDRYRSSGGLPGWQVNLRAITLGLESLRRVERYGIAKRGQQYAGYRELGSGAIELGQGMTAEEAAAIVIRHGRPDASAEEWERAAAQLASRAGQRDDYRTEVVRDALRRTHPDTEGTGDVALFRLVTQARARLEASS